MASRLERESVLSPRWDSARRELWLGEVLVKQFRQPASNQETLLAAFQEENWPPRIDDPLTCGDNEHLEGRVSPAIVLNVAGTNYRMTRLCFKTLATSRSTSRRSKELQKLCKTCGEGNT